MVGFEDGLLIERRLRPVRRGKLIELIELNPLVGTVSCNPSGYE